MSDNYAVINGKRIELTDEQVQTLKFEIRANPFSKKTTTYVFTIVEPDGVDTIQNSSELYDAALSFNDEQFANQVALHQLLYRKLLKFAYDNECEDTAEWDGSNKHWAVSYDYACGTFTTYYQNAYGAQEVYFSSEDGVRSAIKEVVEPFMKEHPNFVW